MPEEVVTSPIDVIRFVSIENEQFLVTLIKSPEELRFVNHLQGLYVAAMTPTEVHENEFAILQLLTLVHHNFLSATASYMRCHLSEAFAAARIAIDAALIAAQIIADRKSQAAYVKREKPFDKLIRHYKNLIKDKKPLPHPLIEELIRVHDIASSFASHADINTFIHRLKRSEHRGKPLMTIQYFQFSTNNTVRRIHWLNLLTLFVMTLDVFSDFLVSEQKQVPQAWQDELRSLGAHIQRRTEELKKSLPPETEPGLT
jgi:hypothetical protein